MAKNLITVSHFFYFTGFPELSSKEIDFVSKALEKDPDNIHTNKNFGKYIFFSQHLEKFLTKSINDWVIL